MAKYFPGPSYVDWIAADGYDRKRAGEQAFAAVFGPWYSAYSGYGKPMMIAETGALANNQAGYLRGIQTLLPSQFQSIKAVVYFDAKGPAADWQLVGSGLQAFQQLAADPYFATKP
jgi:beta-mannanase